MGGGDEKGEGLRQKSEEGRGLPVWLWEEGDFEEAIQTESTTTREAGGLMFRPKAGAAGNALLRSWLNVSLKPRA